MNSAETVIVLARIRQAKEHIELAHRILGLKASPGDNWAIYHLDDARHELTWLADWISLVADKARAAGG